MIIQGDIDNVVTTYNTAATDTASEIFGNERRRKKPWVTKDVLALCVEKDLKKRRYVEEVANEYRNANKVGGGGGQTTLKKRKMTG